jgi:uncharacterized protein YbjT (DUF2867 family)
MKRILITGATGNVGVETIKYLDFLSSGFDIIAGVRDINEQNNLLVTKFVEFDFTNTSTFKPALTDIDILFLLRPPQISDVNKYFKPLIDMAISSGIKHIVFLSVQGVEKSKVIPHHKIEKLIVDSKIPYTFLRPAYFMQNFIGSLNNDLVNKNLIYLPAGNAKFTIVDVSDVGAVAAKILLNTESHLNKIYELTNGEKLNFSEMALKLSIGLGRNISYKSPNLISFFFTKKKEKIPTMLILVMIMLHYLPRFQNEPSVTNWIEKITGNKPVSFKEFLVKNKRLLAV